MDELITRVREVLSTTPDRWRTLTASVELELLAMRPAPGEWSAVECLQHLLDTESAPSRSGFRLSSRVGTLRLSAPMPTDRSPSWLPIPPRLPGGSARLVRAVWRVSPQ